MSGRIPVLGILIRRGTAALVHAGLGETDRALEWLDKAFEERSPQMIFLRSEPMLDPLRADPRFAQLVKRVGFTT